MIIVPDSDAGRFCHGACVKLNVGITAGRGPRDTRVASNQKVRRCRASCPAPQVRDLALCSARSVVYKCCIMAKV